MGFLTHALCETAGGVGCGRRCPVLRASSAAAPRPPRLSGSSPRAPCRSTRGTGHVRRAGICPSASDPRRRGPDAAHEQAVVGIAGDDAGPVLPPDATFRSSAAPFSFARGTVAAGSRRDGRRGRSPPSARRRLAEGQPATVMSPAANVRPSPQLVITAWIIGDCPPWRCSGTVPECSESLSLNRLCVDDLEPVFRAFQWPRRHVSAECEELPPPLTTTLRYRSLVEVTKRSPRVARCAARRHDVGEARISLPRGRQEQHQCCGSQTVPREPCGGHSRGN